MDRHLLHRWNRGANLFLYFCCNLMGIGEGFSLLVFQIEVNVILSIDMMNLEVMGGAQAFPYRDHTNLIFDRLIFALKRLCVHDNINIWVCGLDCRFDLIHNGMGTLKSGRSADFNDGINEYLGPRWSKPYAPDFFNSLHLLYRRTHPFIEPFRDAVHESIDGPSSQTVADKKNKECDTD